MSQKPEKVATLFSLIFQLAPTYEELTSGTPQLAPFIALKDDFEMSERQMVTQLSLRWNILLDSLVYTSQKLKELGFIYYNGEVTQIEEVGEAKKLSKRSYY